jgi:hypothetical protein
MKIALLGATFAAILYASSGHAESANYITSDCHQGECASYYLVKSFPSPTLAYPPFSTDQYLAHVKAIGPASVDIGVKVSLEVVVAGHLVALAAFLVQANPKPAALHIDVLDLHRERRAEAREGIDHEADQGVVAKADRRCHVDAVKQLPCLGRIEHRRLAALHTVRGTADRSSRVHRHDLARHKPIEQMPDRGEALLDGRRGALTAELLDVGRDVQRLHVGDRATPALAHQARNSRVAWA